MDLTSVVGLIAGLIAIVGGQVLEGGSLESIIQPTAALIVLGGTMGAVLLSYSLVDVMKGTKLLIRVFLDKALNFEESINDIIEMANTARREGVLSLENKIDKYKEPFLKANIKYIIDGMEPEMYKQMMEEEINEYFENNIVASKIFESAGGYAPTIGILGAVLGLIHVMEKLNEPSKLGAGIAVAFVATLYGVGSANLLFLPIATKLKRKISRDTRKMAMIMEGLLSIQLGINPRLIKEKLLVYASEEQIEVDDKSPEKPIEEGQKNS